MFTMSNNRNFHASKEEPRSGKFDSTGFKTHSERFVTLIQQRVLSRICVANVQ